MNWLSRISQTGIAPFTVNEIRNSLVNLQNDASGQILFWPDLQLDIKSQSELEKILRYAELFFKSLEYSLQFDKDYERTPVIDDSGEIKRDEHGYPVTREEILYVPKIKSEIESGQGDEDMIEQEIYEMAAAYADDGDLKFSDKFVSFLEFASKHEEESLSLFNDYFHYKELPPREELDKFVDSINAYDSKWTMEGIPHNFSSTQLLEAYEEDAIDPQREPNSFNETLANISNEIFIALNENNKETYPEDLVPYPIFRDLGIEWNSKFIEYLPIWIKPSAIRDVVSNDLLISWTMDYRSEELRQNAEESMSERDSEYITEAYKEIVDQLSFYPELLIEDYDPADSTDPRNDLDLDEVFDFVKEASDRLGYMCHGFEEASNYAQLFMHAIKSVLIRNPSINKYFGNRANKEQSSQFNYKDIFEAIFAMSNIARETKPKKLYEEVKLTPPLWTVDEIPNEFPEQDVRDLVDKIKNDYSSLYSSNGVLGPDEIQKMKELGISPNPFGLKYNMQMDGPEGIYKSFGRSSLKAFRIVVEPSDANIDEGASYGEETAFPREFYKEVGPNAGHDNLYILGFINGYADVYSKNLYITAVESIEQNKNAMFSKEERNKNLQDELNKSMAQLIELSEYQIMTDEYLNAQLTQLENEIQRDPHNQRAIQSLKTIKDMIYQKNKIKQYLGDKDANQYRNELEIKINNLEKDLSREWSHETTFSSWSHLRERLQNVFKDWISVFVNVIFREANKKGYKNIFMIDNADTEELVKYFKKLGAVHRKEYEHSFWAISLENSNIRYAQRKTK